LLGAGDALFGIYTTITIGMGVSIMLTELLRMGIIPELGAHVYEGRIGDSDEFGNRLTATFVISFCAAILGGLVMWLLGLWLLSNQQSPELERAAWVFLWLRIAMMLVVVTLTPAMSILLVSGRQPVFNLFQFLERASELVGVAVPIWLLSGSPSGAPEILVRIGLGIAGLTSATHIAGATFAFSLGPDFQPKGRLPRWSNLTPILRRIAWSSLQTISMNLYVRADILIVAAFAGPVGTVALAVALRLMGYVRQATMGVVNGLDAAFANISGQRRRGQQSGADGVGDVGRRLIDTSTTLQACVIFHLVVIFLLLGPDVMMLWVGDVLIGTGSGSTVSEITRLSTLMIVGMAVRSLSLGWMSAMTGNGNARHFTPLLLPGAIANIGILTGWALFHPETFSVMVVGWVFLVLQLVTHGVVIPIASARSLGTGVADLFRPMVVPFALAAAAYGLGLVWESQASSGMHGYLRVGVLVGLVAISFMGSFAHTVWRRNT
jgi:hypothetical protein